LPPARPAVFNPPMNLVKAITFTLISSLLIAAMSALVRYAGERVPVGEVVFFRAAFAILPVVIIYAWRGELAAAVRTGRPFGHVGRGAFSVGGMFLNFAALARLPLVDATAFSFASPLITVAFAAMFLKERVRLYRWTAVIVGFAGVIVMLWPHLDLAHFSGAASTTSALGALFALTAAIFNAGAVIQTRRLTDSETTSSIVLDFSLICALAGLCTLPFGWSFPSHAVVAVLVATGILGELTHIFLTESYRYAPASVVAPFGYTAMLWAFELRDVIFAEIPVLVVVIGAGIVTGAGLIVIFRERQLGLRRERDAEAPPAVG
jgi:drug/metabolite transporter (DMT)-like permease